MFNISFFIIIFCLSNKIISNDNKDNDPNSCDEKYNKEFCKSQKVAKIISIIVGIILVILFILLIFCMIFKRNTLQNEDIQSNFGVTLYINNVNDPTNKNFEKKKKIYLFENIMRPIKYIKEHEIYGTQCMICLDNLIENNEICLTSCKHVFHYNCLKDYIMKTEDSHCPDCKFDFFSLLENEIIDYSEINDNTSRNENENLSILVIQNNINNSNDINNNYNNNQNEGNINNTENNSENYRLTSGTNRNRNHTNEILLNEEPTENLKNEGDNKKLKDERFDLKNNKNYTDTGIIITNNETQMNERNNTINKNQNNNISKENEQSSDDFSDDDH